MEKELSVTDLIDTEVLQRLQDGFAEMTGMAALTTDVNGKPVTRGSNFTDFCNLYTRNSPVGGERCEQCDRHGAEETRKNGRPQIYYCHAGLMDFSAPIMANDRLVGCFIGGQVLVKPVEEEHVRRVAEEIGVDEEEYLTAARKVNIRQEEQIERAADFLHIIASVLSDIAYGKHMAIQANEEIERAANMKSDFLANMSHEIRTPMNAVIGMAEMALREEVSPAAREYILQIKSSGRTMLRIINDILDFSKIESGKMDINPVEYGPMSVVNDMVNIVMPRLRDKDVELVLDISPDIPDRLLGDNIRIKQILINLVNNAIKFTQKGAVTVRMEGVRKEERMTELSIEIEDTGIGIKKEDIGKLFRSFQQLDSKRNRNIEGTGLGLAISKRLLVLMEGDIQVESEYGKGSKFSVKLPQEIIDPVPGISVKNMENALAVLWIDNPYVEQQLRKDLSVFHIEYAKASNIEELCRIPEGKEQFLFVERMCFNMEVEEFAKSHPSWTIVLMIDYFDAEEYRSSNIVVVKKPLYALNIAMIFNKEKIHYAQEGSEDEEFNFIAPEAEILVVDDNSLNLTVVEGLLEPLKMKIDTALSGREAIDKISVHHYDLVFMDHMMPELDGVETTHIIRRFHKEYDDTPIIALTANAVDGTKEMFLKEGMNDFVPKPIELRLLVSKVRQWLPVEKILHSIANEETDTAEKETKPLLVGNLDTALAVSLLGSEKLFWTVLKDYYCCIERKSAEILSFYEKEDWASYTIGVHALKSASKQIGAVGLSEKAAELEKAGNARDLEFIRAHTMDMLKEYQEYISVLMPYFPEQVKREEEKPLIAEKELFKLFDRLQEAVENLDMDGMQEVLDGLQEYRFSEKQKPQIDKLKRAIEEMDVEVCEELMKGWSRV